MSELLEGEFFEQEQNQQKAKKLFHNTCKILAKATAAAWAKRCKLWKDPNQYVKDTSIVRGQETTTTKTVCRKRKGKGAGKTRYVDKRLCTQTQILNFAIEFPPVRQLTLQEIEEDETRKRKEDLASRAALEKKERAKVANKRSIAKKAAGKTMRTKKKNKKVAQPGEQCITDHFEAQTTQPKTAQTMTADKEETTTTKPALATAKITNFFQYKTTKTIKRNDKDRNEEENNKINKQSSSKNACNAHPPKGTKDGIATEDSMEIRRGIG
jgi:hypothetical protein